MLEVNFEVHKYMMCAVSVIDGKQKGVHLRRGYAYCLNPKKFSNKHVCPIPFGTDNTNFSQIKSCSLLNWTYARVETWLVKVYHPIAEPAHTYSLSWVFNL